MSIASATRPDSKDYLWHGEIVEVMTYGHPHGSVVMNVADLLREIYPKAAWHIREEKVLVLVPKFDEPMPDVMVIRGPKSSYKDHPRAADVELLVEVSHSTLKKDQNEKLEAYAAAGIPRYLIAVVESEVVIDYSDPDPAGRYLTSRVYGHGEELTLGERGVIRVDDVFAA